MGVVFDGFGYVYKGKEGENIEVSGEQIKDMPDEEYQNLISTVLDIQRKDTEAQAIQDKAKKAEDDRLAKIKADQEAEGKRLEDIACKQKAQQDEIDAANRKIEEDKRKAADDIKIREEKERLKKELEEKAKKEAEETAKCEAEEKAEKERVAKIEADLTEKLKPDNEKLLALARDIRLLKMPELSNSQSHEILNKARGHLDRAAQILRQGT